MRFGGALIRCGVVAFALMRATSAFGQAETALDRYIAAPDPNYRYELLSAIAGDGLKWTPSAGPLVPGC